MIHENNYEVHLIDRHSLLKEKLIGFFATSFNLLKSIRAKKIVAFAHLHIMQFYVSRKVLFCNKCTQVSYKEDFSLFLDNKFS